MTKQFAVAPVRKSVTSVRFERKSKRPFKWVVLAHTPNKNDWVSVLWTANIARAYAFKSSNQREYVVVPANYDPTQTKTKTGSNRK
jgi:hypothetical protein